MLCFLFCLSMSLLFSQKEFTLYWPKKMENGGKIVSGENFIKNQKNSGGVKNFAG